MSIQESAAVPYGEAGEERVIDVLQREVLGWTFDPNETGECISCAVGDDAHDTVL